MLCILPQVDITCKKKMRMLQSTDPERMANKEGSCNIRCFLYFNNKQSKIKIMKFISLTRHQKELKQVDKIITKA